MDPRVFTNGCAQGEDSDLGLTHTIRCVGDGATSQVWLYDALYGLDTITGGALDTYITLSAPSVAAAPGESTTLVTSLGGSGVLPNPGDTIFIWDIVSYVYRSAVVKSAVTVGPNTTIITTPQTGLDIAFSSGSLVGYTPPFDDVYKISVEAKITAVTNGHFAYGFLDESPLAFTSINDLLTEASLNWSKITTVGSAVNVTMEENVTFLPRMKPSRYFCVVTDAVVAASEVITVYLSRKRWNSIAGALTVNGATDIS